MIKNRVGTAGFVLAMIVPFVARADNFASASYDPKTDELVVTLRYRGTNPNHEFSVQWGSCKTSSDGVQHVTAVILDKQWNDAARMPFKKTARFGLANAPCRPAAVTLQTAPHFRHLIMIPKLPGK